MRDLTLAVEKGIECPTMQHDQPAELQERRSLRQAIHIDVATRESWGIFFRVFFDQGSLLYLKLRTLVLNEGTKVSKVDRCVGGRSEVAWRWVSTAASASVRRVLLITGWHHSSFIRLFLVRHELALTLTGLLERRKAGHSLPSLVGLTREVVVVVAVTRLRGGNFRTLNTWLASSSIIHHMICSACIRRICVAATTQTAIFFISCRLTVLGAPGCR